MKTIRLSIAAALAIGSTLAVQAQSTTGGRSGGSTASTGTGYLTEGKRTAASNPSSMTIADEGASRAYMYVPPTKAKNRSASPDGSGGHPKNPSGTATGTPQGKSSAKKKI